jgi:type I restriction enzyme M protein
LSPHAHTEDQLVDLPAIGLFPGDKVSDGGLNAQLETLSEELETLNAQARTLEQTIATNVAGILEA